MTLEGRWLARTGRGELIVDERACAKCGYDLVGLRTTGECPECGHPIWDENGQELERARFASGGPVLRDTGVMTEAPEDFQRLIAWAGNMLSIGAMVMAAGMVVFAMLSAAVGAITLVAGAFVWLQGVMAVLTPRPLPEKVEVRGEAEWRGLRTLSKWSGAGWFGGGLMLLAAQFAGWYLPAEVGPMIAYPAAVVLLMALAGTSALSLYMSNLAFWASHTRLGDQLRVAVVGIGAAWAGFAMLLLTGMLDEVIFMRLPVRTPVEVFWYGVLVLSVCGVAWFVWCVWDFASMGQWLVRGCEERARAEERAEARRAREKANPAPAFPLAGTDAPVPLNDEPVPLVERSETKLRRPS